MEIIFRLEKLFYFLKCKCYNLSYNVINTKVRITVAKVVDFISSSDEDMKDYEKKIWRHRMAVIFRYVLVGVLLLILVFGIRYYLNNRSFTGYSIASSVERTDALTTQYAPFAGNILKYSRDGISYTDEENSLYFSITYTMQDPIIALSEKAGVVADKNGNQIYIFDKEQQKGQITTLLPIKKIAVSNQGVAAVLMEENNASKLEIYSAEGTLLGSGEFAMDKSGYPMNLSISADGTKIAIAFAQVAGTKSNCCIAVYNFDQVGENYVDHLVFAKNYSDYLLPELHYFDDRTFAAVGDGILSFYQGSQIPEVLKEVTFEETIEGVFYGESSVALVFSAENGRILRLYDLKGNVISEISFAMDYDNIRISDKSVVIYSDTELGVYTYGGKEVFRQSFESSAVDIFLTGSRSKYLFIYTNETQLIKLQ